MGTNAVHEYKSYYQAIGGDSINLYGIPVEDDGGGGTAGGHPEEGKC